jgi:hypothetical protein
MMDYFTPVDNYYNRWGEIMKNRDYMYHIVDLVIYYMSSKTDNGPIFVIWSMHPTKYNSESCRINPSYALHLPWMSSHNLFVHLHTDSQYYKAEVTSSSTVGIMAVVIRLSPCRQDSLRLEKLLYAGRFKDAS